MSKRRSGPTPLHRLAAHEEVARDAHQRDHRQVLVDGGDAAVERVARASEDAPARRSIRISPRLGAVDAGEDLDQRRLAGAVVAEQAMHLAGARRPRRRPFSAMTEPKCLLMFAKLDERRVAISGSRVARRDVAVEQHRDQQHGAQEHLEPVGVDAGVEDAHLHDAEDQRAEQRRRSPSRSRRSAGSRRSPRR